MDDKFEHELTEKEMKFIIDTTAKIVDEVISYSEEYEKTFDKGKEYQYLMMAVTHIFTSTIASLMDDDDESYILIDKVMNLTRANIIKKIKNIENDI